MMKFFTSPFGLSKKFLVPATLLLLAMGCASSHVFNPKAATEPTKVYTTETPALKETKDGETKAADTKAIPDGAIIVDARSPFDYGLSHIPGSINVRWDEFTQSVEPFKGVFEGDLFHHARRLARMGLAPDAKVVVVGRGRNGKGEEGRVAWTLKYLGFKDVSFMGVEAFHRPTQFDKEVPRKAVAVWKPELDESLLITKEQIKTSLSGDPAAKLAPVASTEFQILDVSNTPNKKMSRPTPFDEIDMIQIPWSEFVDAKGFIDPTIKSRLGELGLSSKKQIIVISHRGIEAGTVVLVLREMGFEKSALFSGGYALLQESGSAHKPLKK